MALTYLKGKLQLFKEVFLVDNSTDEAIIKAQIIKGTLIEFDKDPGWVKDILSLYKKIHRLF